MGASSVGSTASVAANDICKKASLTNEASVEKWFVDPLLHQLGYGPDDQFLKTSIQELKVGKGSKSSLYKPDYIIRVHGFPVMVIDAKSPSEPISKWVQQCGSYCLELNKQYEHNPVEYYVVTNGLQLALYKWDQGKPLVECDFGDFVAGNLKFIELKNRVSKSAINLLSKSLTRNRDSCVFFVYLSISGIRSAQDGAPRAGPTPDTAMPRRCRSSPRSLLPAAGCDPARRMFARLPSAGEAGKSLWPHLVA